MESKSDCGLFGLGVLMIGEVAFSEVVSGEEESLVDCNPLFTIIPHRLALSMEVHNEFKVGYW